MNLWYKKIQKDFLDKKDIIILAVLYAISIISAIYTYEGFLSLMSVFATMLYTYSVWQKKISIYKILGIPVGIIWIIYNIYIASIFGIILEIALLNVQTNLSNVVSQVESNLANKMLYIKAPPSCCWFYHN